MPKTTTDFDEFLDDLFDDSIDEIYFLYISIQNEANIGGYKTEKKGTQLFVKNNLGETTLRIQTNIAKEAFLKILDHRYSNGFGTVFGNYEFVRSMSKDD